MALSILDGNQSATTLSTIVTSGQHIPAHTVVSLGTQAVVDITSAISGTSVCVGNLGLLQSTVATEGLPASGSFIKIGGHTGTSTTGNIVHVSAVGALRVDGSVYTQPVSIASVTIGNTVTIAGTVTANPTGTQTIAGTVTAETSLFSRSNPVLLDTSYNIRPVAGRVSGGGISSSYEPIKVSSDGTLSIAGTVTANLDSALPAGTNRIGVVTIGAGTVTIGAGTAQIGSFTASISGTVPVSGTFFQGTQPVSLTTLPALVASTAQIGSVTASISNSVTIASFATSVTARLINPAGTAVTYAEVGTAGSPSIDVLSVQGVSGGTSLLISGTTGSFTTRFGLVTTANTAQISTAVTNLSRKYLFVQNVTTSSNVITVGIGFTPTTTQGIQLAAGALIDFESSFIPTGAVYILSSVTGSPFTILEA